MKTGLKALVAAALVASLAGCETIRSVFWGDDQATAEAREPRLKKIADNVWLHQSWLEIAGHGEILSNGMVVKTDGGVLLVDTAWNDIDTLRLIDLITDKVGEAPRAAIATHAHADKMGGMAAANTRMSTAAFALTNEDAPARGLTPALNTIPEDSINGPLTLQIKGANNETLGSGTFDVFYPGPGHTRDNIVIYYAPEKVLFGGCLIRPADAENLGNAADGDVANWAAATRAVAERFPDAEIVIPSHGAPGGRELLDHTIALAEAAANE